jgi:hypothetical protein
MMFQRPSQTYTSGPKEIKYQPPKPNPLHTPAEHLANTIGSIIDFAKAGGQLSGILPGHPTISPDVANLANSIITGAHTLHAGLLNQAAQRLGNPPIK